MVRVQAATLQTNCIELLEAVGAPASNARKIAESLVASDLNGHHSHGVIRLPMYHDMMEGGALDPAATPVIEREDDLTATVDGQSAFGQVVGYDLVDLGVTKASNNGMSVIGVHDAGHLGRIGEWAGRAAGHDMMFIALVNSGGGAAAVAPPGSADRRLSTNPLAFGIPTFDALEFSIVHDMATSQVAGGKIRERRQAKRPLPDGWTITESGEPVTEPDEFFEAYSDTGSGGAGALLPFGGRVSGYKGFGLGIVAEFFAGILGRGLVQGQGDPDWFSNAASFVFIDPVRFTTRHDIETQITAFNEYLQATEFTPGLDLGPGARGDQYLLPGEPEYRTREHRRQHGIPLPDDTMHALRDFASEQGITHWLASETAE